MKFCENGPFGLPYLQKFYLHNLQIGQMSKRQAIPAKSNGWVQN